MMVICTEAGLGLEPAIDRVGREIAAAHADVAEELLNAAREMRVNADRRLALMNMAARAQLPSLRRLSVTLVQTLQYGTPLSQALRALSTEMRQEALTRFEARAGRLPTLLTVPMIVFILPCVFMIVGGPAIVHVMQGHAAIGSTIMKRLILTASLAMLVGCTAPDAGRQVGAAGDLRVADAAMASGLPQTALSVTRDILQSDPRNVGALLRQGAALTALGQTDAAEECYRRAVEIDPALGRICSAWGSVEAALATGDARQAEAMFRRAIEVAPGDTWRRTIWASRSICRNVMRRRRLRIMRR